MAAKKKKRSKRPKSTKLVEFVEMKPGQARAINEQFNRVFKDFDKAFAELPKPQKKTKKTKKTKKKAKKVTSSALITFDNPYYRGGKLAQLPPDFDWTNPELMRQQGWEIKTRKLDRDGRPIKKKRASKARVTKTVKTDFSPKGIANRVVSTLLLDMKTGKLTPGPAAIIAPGARWRRTKRKKTGKKR